MNRVVEWVRFIVNIIVKSGFLGKYELASTAHMRGVKSLERTILTMEDEITEFKSQNRTLNEKLKDAISNSIHANEKLDFFNGQKFERETLESEIRDLKSTLTQAENLSEQLKMEMKKWRT